MTIASRLKNIEKLIPVNDDSRLIVRVYSDKPARFFCESGEGELSEVTEAEHDRLVTKQAGQVQITFKML